MSAISASGKGRGHGKKKGTSQASRAGLQFPPSRVSRRLRKTYRGRMGAGAPIYLTAVMEYIAAEVLELASSAAQQNKRSRIIPRHIQLAIRNDGELDRLLKNVVLPEAGVLPHIEYKLLPKGKGNGATTNIQSISSGSISKSKTPKVHLKSKKAAKTPSSKPKPKPKPSTDTTSKHKQPKTPARDADMAPKSIEDYAHDDDDHNDEHHTPVSTTSSSDTSAAAATTTTTTRPKGGFFASRSIDA